jgi:hypothetical protein
VRPFIRDLLLEGKRKGKEKEKQKETKQGRKSQEKGKSSLNHKKSSAGEELTPISSREVA